MSDIDCLYARVEFLNTWKYKEGGSGTMAGLSVVHEDKPAAYWILFAVSPEQQSALETAFMTKAQCRFSVQEEVTLDEAHKEQRRLAADELRERQKDSHLAAMTETSVATLRALWFPI